MNDWLLLQDYIAHRSEKAFGELVQRHLGMVYGTALRKLREPHAAQDVTQAVFILLARKAGSLSSGVVLGGWLYRTTCLLSLKLLRDEQRRKAREKESLMMPSNDSQEAQLWEQIAPHLDDALAQLSEPDRNSIILRFIEQRSFREISEGLRINEEAAKKRVSRALEKLRAAIATRGVAATSAALTASIGIYSQAAPPPALASLCISNALVSGPLTSAGVEALLRGTASHSASATLKWTIAVAVLTLLTFFGAKQFSKAKNTSHTAVPGENLNTTVPVASAPSVEPIATEIAANVLLLRVQRAEDQSIIPNAEVYSIIRSNPSRRATVYTDSEGIVRLPLPPPEEFPGMSLWIGAPDRVPINVSWGRQEALALPREYTVKLAAGHRLVGRVVDEEGRGVASARLKFNGEGIEWNRRESVSYVPEVSRPTTDAQGYWEGNFFPARFEWLAGKIEHGDYAITTFSRQIKVTDADPLVFTLQRGVSVTGVVKDSSGVPLGDAKLDLQDLSGWRDNRAASSDLEGHFEIDRIAEGEFALRISAAEHQPETVHLRLNKSGTNLNVTLQPVLHAGDATLRGRVVDHLGRSMRYITVRLITTNRSDPAWSAEIDDNGRFEWRHAPEGILRIGFSGGGEDQKILELAADGTEHEVRYPAKPTIQLRGKVIDARTGNRVRNAKLMLQPPADFPGSERPEWLGEAYDGSFQFPVEQSKIAYSRSGQNYPFHGKRVSTNALLFVDAPEYRRATLQIPGQTNDMELIIKLEAGGSIKGRVFFANGEPAAGAEVAFRTKSASVAMEKPGKFAKSYEPNVAPRALVDESGSFDLGEPPFDAERVLVAHDFGWASVALREVVQDPITLRHWGRVEGAIRIPARTGETRSVMISNASAAADGMTFTFYAEPDAVGNFVFEKVPAGEAQVSLTLSRSRIGVFSHPQNTSVRSGETTSVIIGAGGVRFGGRVVFPSPRDDVDWTRSGQHLVLQQKQQPRSDHGIAPQSYGFFCEPDGTFRVDGVLPGKYRLMLSAVSKKDHVDQLGNVRDINLGRRMVDVIIGAKDVNQGDVMVELSSKAE